MNVKIGSSEFQIADGLNDSGHYRSILNAGSDLGNWSSCRSIKIWINVQHFPELAGTGTDLLCLVK